MIWENIGLILVMLLSIYGCAQLIRTICLWFARCPKSVKTYRLAVLTKEVAPEPLLRCLQAQAVWKEEPVVLILPPCGMGEDYKERLSRGRSNAPSVEWMDPEDLPDFLGECRFIGEN